MLRLSIQPVRLAFPFVLKSATLLLAGGLGGTLQARITKLGLEPDLFVKVSLVDINTASSNSLINGIMKNGDLEQESDILFKMPEKKVVSWTTMVTGFSENGDHRRALAMFPRMLEILMLSLLYWLAQGLEL
ncbi:hypothetical protein HHK36_003380 [Tetracentron sinense]|uniref:Pentatricopeptide repeat-containing protein n=1 Tax=Tetracentron sinense TaxID=13715 RepID=A0A834ZTA0_TETSI|nr:hypothetical protein HHK36_003380 [Tetracentron sinense]